MLAVVVPVSVAAPPSVPLVAEAVGVMVIVPALPAVKVWPSVPEAAGASVPLPAAPVTVPLGAAEAPRPV